MERGFYIMAYDIPSDKRRAKIAKKMEAIGERVQWSVFEAYLSRPELDKLLSQVKKILDEKEDSLRIYPLCSACREKPKMIGRSQLTPPPGVMIV
jgi:CRISPR-associated protein Cas2